LNQHETEVQTSLHGLKPPHLQALSKITLQNNEPCTSVHCSECSVCAVDIVQPILLSRSSS